MAKVELKTQAQNPNAEPQHCEESRRLEQSDHGTGAPHEAAGPCFTLGGVEIT
jgi:hypothetical protein